MQNWKVTEDAVNQRVDLFLASKLPQLSRSSIQKLVSSGKLYVNDSVEKTSYKLKIDDKVSLNYDFSKEGSIPDIKLPVIYEDKDCVVIDKPTGILTHSKGAFNPEATIATFIAPKITGMTGDRAGIVHRLDRATSGVIIAAKTPEALHWLQKQFSARKTKKTYIAVIEGSLKPRTAIIDVPIERNPRKPQTFRTGSGGKPAITAYETLKDSDNYSLVELRPQTGRTHQLRVHLNYLGHPIVGDTLYGGQDAERLYLHAHKLELTLPSRERKIFISKLPESFNAIMK